MTRKLTVGGCQLLSTTDIQFNITQIKKAIDWAADNQVDILATPECALSGYLWAPPNEHDPRVYEIHNGLVDLQKYSLEKKVDLVLGTGWYNKEGRWANALIFIADGQCFHVHNKSVLFPAESEFYAAGDTVNPVEYKGFKIAGLICSDLWSNPMQSPGQSAALLNRLKTCEIDVLFVSSNTPKGHATSKLSYDWHKSCVEMYGCYGSWQTVVCDGFELNVEPTCVSGIVDTTGAWVEQAEPVKTAYFKRTLTPTIPWESLVE